MENKNIIGLVVSGEVEKAFSALIEYILNRKEYSALLNDAISGLSNFNSINNEYKKGVIEFHQFFQYNAKSINLLLSILQKIEESPLIEDEKVVNSKVNHLSQTIILSEELKEKVIPSEERVVFTFGDIGVGKTTIIQSLGNFLATSSHYETAFSPHDNKEILFWNSVANELKNIESYETYLRYPNRTPCGTVEKLTIAIRNDKTKPRLISLVEASGEDLTKIIDKRYNRYELFQSEIEESSFFLIVLPPYTECREDADLLCSQFLQLLNEKKENYKVGVVISKWDLLANPMIELSAYMFYKLPITSKVILNSKKIIDHKIFTFSIFDSIRHQDFSSESNIIKWINQ